MIKFDLVILALVALLFSVNSHSAVVVSPVVQGYSAAAKTYQGAAAAANSGFAAEGIINVGGRAATAPATMRFAANAGQYALAATRLNPAALAVGAIAAWLLPYGLKWIDGQWRHMIPASTSSVISGWNRAGIFVSTQQEACTYYGSLYTVYTTTDTGGTCRYCSGPYDCMTLGVTRANSCAGAGNLISTTNCTIPAVNNPATDADFAVVPVNNPLPDPVADQLADTNPVPVEDPVYSPADVATGPAYTKPDGSTAEPRAKISPAGPGQVTVDTYEKPLTNPDGTSALAAPVQDTPEPPKDPCEEHPDRVGCVDLGNVDDSEVQTQQHSPISITPVSIGGAGSCPAPLTGSFLGKPVAFKFDFACSAANMLKPLILAMAWLSAGIIFIGGVRNG